MKVTQPPTVSDDMPLDIVAEGAGPQPGVWPEVTNRTPVEQMIAHAGNGQEMRNTALLENRGAYTDEYRAFVEARSNAAE